MYPDVLIDQPLDLPRGAVVQVNTRIISLGMGRRDTAIFVDGSRVAGDLMDTRAENVWATHNITWVGKLGLGKHTISLRGGDGYFGCNQPGAPMTGDWGSIDTLIFAN